MRRPRLLDLCCGVGGASAGFAAAGFEVTGVDIAPQPRYPFDFVQADAIEYGRAHGAEFDFVHASFPCQRRAAITRGTNAHLQDRYPDLLPEGREMLLALGRPFSIETTGNRRDVVLCGTMFGLKVFRHRSFEVGGDWFPMRIPHVGHTDRVRGVRHGVNYAGGFIAAYGDGGGKATVPEMQREMGIDWTDVRHELTEAIPPAYARFMGEQAIAQLRTDYMT